MKPSGIAGWLHYYFLSRKERFDDMEITGYKSIFSKQDADIFVDKLAYLFLQPRSDSFSAAICPPATNIDFLSEASAFRMIYIASGIWQDVDWGIIVYMATLANGML